MERVLGGRWSACDVLKCAVEHVGERAQKRIWYRYSVFKCAFGPVRGGWTAEGFGVFGEVGRI